MFKLYKSCFINFILNNNIFEVKTPKNKKNINKKRLEIVSNETFGLIISFIEYKKNITPHIKQIILRGLINLICSLFITLYSKITPLYNELNI
jgi:hypothetical protein